MKLKSLKTKKYIAINSLGKIYSTVIIIKLDIIKVLSIICALFKTLFPTSQLGFHLKSWERERGSAQTRFSFLFLFVFWGGGGGGGSVTENICIWLNPWFALVILVDVTLHGKLDIASLITDFWAQVTLKKLPNVWTRRLRAYSFSSVLLKHRETSIKRTPSGPFQVSA